MQYPLNKIKATCFFFEIFFSKQAVKSSSIIFFTLFLSWSSLTPALPAAQQTTDNSLVVGIGVSRTSNKNYTPVFDKFERETGIKIIRHPLRDMKSLDKDKLWYTAKGEPIDVINGYASIRLFEYFHQGKVQAITHMWQEQNLDASFSQTKNTVSLDDEIVGLPTEINGWFIFYMQSLNLFNAPINNFNQLVDVCHALHKAKVVPFYITEKSPYAIMAWFEFITLRTFGLDFLTQLTQGKVSYLSPEVTEIMNYWQQLVEANCFADPFGALSARELFPFFYRGKIAMMLTSRSILMLKKDEKKYGANLMAFPKISEIPRYEVAPIDLFFANKASKKQKQINQFLSFVAQQETQSDIANRKNRLAAHTGARAQNKLHGLGVKEKQLLTTAHSFSSFIDRMLPAQFETESRQLFIDFIRSGDKESFQHSMELLRVKHYDI